MCQNTLTLFKSGIFLTVIFVSLSSWAVVNLIKKDLSHGINFLCLAKNPDYVTAGQWTLSMIFVNSHFVIWPAINAFHDMCQPSSLSMPCNIAFMILTNTHYSVCPATNSFHARFEDIMAGKLWCSGFWYHVHLSVDGSVSEDHCVHYQSWCGNAGKWRTLFIGLEEGKAEVMGQSRGFCLGSR
jgi:hypothetical protein